MIESKWKTPENSMNLIGQQTWDITEFFCGFPEPKGSGGGVSSSGGSSAPVQPVGGLFQGGVPKLRSVGGVMIVKNVWFCSI